MSLQAVIANLLSLKSSLKVGQEKCFQLKHIIANEHIAISKHDINALESIVGDKENISSDLERTVHKVVDQVMGLNEGEVESLSGIQDILSALKKTYAGDDLQAQTLRFLVDECAESIQRLLESADSLRIELHRNMMVIQRMMADHQESYRFWQSIAAEEGSQYGEKGERQSSGHCSQFAVKI